MKPAFHPAAEREFSASMEWYEARVPGLGAQMRVEMRRAIDAICVQPFLGKPFGINFRRVTLRRFPFALIYRVDGDNLRIIAVAHTRRRPGYWSSRR
jgi:hypothetical protein